eukprot:gene5959-6563_t
MMWQPSFFRHLSKLSATSTRSLSSSSTSKYFHLPQSKVFSVSGADSKKFLQGLITNDIQKLKAPHDCIAAAFLTPKGRVLITALLYQSPLQEDQIFIETHEDHVKDVSRHLNMYKLKSQVTIQAVDHQVAFSTNPIVAEDGKIVCQNVDPRLPGFGYRAITSSSAAVPQPSKEDLLWYEKRRFLRGLPEGSEIRNRIPLECNLDLLQHISFEKGCYIGQELTARTKHQGLVRKRLVPFIAKTESSKLGTFRDLYLPEETNFVAMEGVKARSKLFPLSAVKRETVIGEDHYIGEVVALSSNNSIGFAMIQLEALSVANPCVFAAVESDVEKHEEESEQKGAKAVVSYIQPFLPAFLPSEAQ